MKKNIVSIFVSNPRQFYLFAYYKCNAKKKRKIKTIMLCGLLTQINKEYICIFILNLLFLIKILFLKRILVINTSIFLFVVTFVCLFELISIGY
jgi:hypothetical protein